MVGKQGVDEARSLFDCALDHGVNLIDTANEVKEVIATASAAWPDEMRAAVQVGSSNDQSHTVDSMVKQLEGSVLTAIALVMIVVLASLGIRPALLVGFSSTESSRRLLFLTYT